MATSLGCGSGERASPAGSGGGRTSPITGAGGSGGGVLHDVPSTGASTTASTSTSASTSGGACPATPPIEGTPIFTPDGEWTWVPIAGATCRDGSATGIGVRLRAGSNKVFVYLEGGGACFNGSTCAISAASFGSAAFDAWAATVGKTGIFDPVAAANPVQTWSAIYVPYCTGDVHAGDATSVDVTNGPAGQDFLGYRNIGLYLQRLVPTFKHASQVLLTGASAGGFGAALNYDRVAAAFCPQPVTLLDDSGPPMSDAYLAPCLQKQWRGLWNLAATLPQGCSDCDDANGGGLVNTVTYLAARWPESRLGLVSSTRDAVISTFYGFGTDDCTSSTPLSGSTYAAGLVNLRDDYMAPSGAWSTYFVDSTQHTYLLGPGFYTTTVNGRTLPAWVGELLAGETNNVGP